MCPQTEQMAQPTAGTPSKSLVKKKKPPIWGTPTVFQWPNTVPHRRITTACRYGAGHKRGSHMLVYSWGYGWPLSSHSVKLVHSRQFNSVLQAWFMWNPTEHNPMALGVLEAERCCWQSNVDRKVSAPKTILAGKPNSSFRHGGDPSSQQPSRFVLWFITGAGHGTLVLHVSSTQQPVFSLSSFKPKKEVLASGIL